MQTVNMRSEKWVVSRVDVLGDPGDQSFGLEDHLISVAALNRVSINQTADTQVVRIWTWNDTEYF